MKSFVEQARTYYSYHTKEATRYTHFVGVPLVVISLMILTGFVHISVPGVFNTNLAQLLTLALLVYYFILNWVLALAAVPIFALLLWFSNHFSAQGPTTAGIWAFAITFILGWTIQIAGHVIEGKRPAFLDNLSQALIAPLFLTAEVFFILGKMDELRTQIQQPKE